MMCRMAALSVAERRAAIAALREELLGIDSTHAVVL
jgi:hypothetical protein